MMGIDKLRLISGSEPKRSFFDSLNADFRLSDGHLREFVYNFKYRDRATIEAIEPSNEVSIHTKPGVEPSLFVQLNYQAPGGKLPPQTVVECNPNKFHNGFSGVDRLLDSIFWLKDSLKITRLDLNADVAGVSVQYFRDALRYPKKRKSGDIGEWRKRGTETVYVGRSPSLLRIYDKRAEQKYRGADLRGFPEVLTRLEWETRQGRWNKLPHVKDVVHFGDLSNLLEFEPFARIELFEVPAYDFEQNPREAVRQFTFDALTRKQGAQSAVSILNKGRHFRRDYGGCLINRRDVCEQIERSYRQTTQLFFENKGADVSFIYGPTIC
jgi:hypothetical protein